MTQDEINDLIIVGGGPGGLTAGIYAMRAALKTVLIETIFNARVAQIQSNAAGVSAVVLEDTKTGEQKELSTEGVFIFVGFSPNNQLVPAGIKVSPRGYVITDEKCETSIPGIFAIGDLRQKYANQIVVAAADGCTAALATAHYVEKQKASTVCSGLPA